jgi:hypothetical protein
MRVPSLLLFAALAACQSGPQPFAALPDAAPTPTAPPEPSKHPSPPCVVACRALYAAGCPEGAKGTCYRILAKIEQDRSVTMAGGGALTCAAVAGVTSQSEARALGVPCKP